MRRDVTITGRAVVTFKKVIRGVDLEEIEEIKGDHDVLASQISTDDILEIEEVQSVSMECQP